MTKKDFSNKRKAREITVQSLYALTQPNNQASLAEAVDFALESGHFPDEGYGESVPEELFVPLIKGVLKNIDAIDDIIQSHLNEWSMDRLAKIDVAILRLAVYEMYFLSDSDVPDKVAIDEAIELSKFFSNDNSRKFINGVLHQLFTEKHEN
ncbi:transcription antitermination factor NusB [Aerococcaceae bacterium DSM 111020]|nr:transcription antitermination factor NusB [Aerococcaceae bacterium DSM 111020]